MFQTTLLLAYIAKLSYYQPWRSTELFNELISSKIFPWSTNLNIAANWLVTASSCAARGCQSVFTKKSQTLPKKSQVAVLRHSHIKYAWPNTKQTLELTRNIDTIQFYSLEAFTFPVITLSYICFLSKKLIIFMATVKSFLYFVHPAWL